MTHTARSAASAMQSFSRIAFSKVLPRTLEVHESTINSTSISKVITSSSPQEIDQGMIVFLVAFIGSVLLCALMCLCCVRYIIFLRKQKQTQAANESKPRGVDLGMKQDSTLTVDAANDIDYWFA